MNVGIIGSGGREHAITFSLSKSKKIGKIFCMPGNAGTENIAKNIKVDISDFKKIEEEVKKNNIELLIIGPEKPLVDGIVDFFQDKNIKVFGPNKYAAKLEGSKAFMKSICKKNKIPTAKFKICKNKKDVKNFLKNSKVPLVVKADGLAAGKGVKICKTKEQIFNVSNEIFQGKFKTSNKLVLEEFLEGEEASYFLIVDKKGYKFLALGTDMTFLGDGIREKLGKIKKRPKEGMTSQKILYDKFTIL